jgi:2-polyprenyl-3-methyl-5-hydroxy-6-metoxy-1,4-benzoquinol methylase
MDGMTTTQQPRDASAVDAQASAVEELTGRLFQSAVGAVDLLAIYLGDRLGWYRRLRSDGPMTARELAERTGTEPRYAREWLEQQAVTGLARLSDDADPWARRYHLSAAAAEVLTDESSLSYLAPLGRILAGTATQLPALLAAYRSGGGVSWAQFGVEARESQADMNRPWFERMLPAALAGVPAVDGALRRPGARVADIGCGGGWSTIALARAYPNASFDGIDADLPSVEMARANAAAAGVADRVRFSHADARALSGGPFDVVFAFECVHDMPYPVEVLHAAAESLGPGGCVVVMDEAVAETFTAPGDELERMMYGFSLLVCLPDGMSHPASAATGTVMRPETLRRYAADAGLSGFEILPVQDFGFWRFYRLTP